MIEVSGSIIFGIIMLIIASFFYFLAGCMILIRYNKEYLGFFCCFTLASFIVYIVLNSWYGWVKVV